MSSRTFFATTGRPPRPTHFRERIIIPSVHHRDRAQRQEFRAWLQLVFTADFLKDQNRDLDAFMKYGLGHRPQRPSQRQSSWTRGGGLSRGSIFSKTSTAAAATTSTDVNGNSRSNANNNTNTNANNSNSNSNSNSNITTDDNHEVDDLGLLLLKVNAVRRQMCPLGYHSNTRLAFEAFNRAVNCLPAARQHRFFDLFGGQPGSFTLDSLAVFLEMELLTGENC